MGTAFAAPLAPGQQLDHGRYSVGRALSQGGMGALYLATDHGAFGRTVVVKMLLDAPHGADEAERRAARVRFADEARTLAALRHPFIPKIFAYFTDGPACFIVMEHIDGRDLQQGLTRADETDQLVRGAPHPVIDVARWGAALCGVLEYLHARRPQPVLHQDIKPANLVLDQHSGALFLVDFGTAQAHSGLHTGGYGTPGYAPPEQYRGQSEPRSDVYALASTLYHLASDDDPGLHPFSFPQLDALGELGDALRPALSKDIAARPQAIELRRALEVLGRPAAAPALATPDGASVYDERQIAPWCERNWEQAAQWLRSRALPSELEQRWGKAALARRLRGAAGQHPADDYAALDAALALLDPQGYGAARPDLAATPGALECRLQRGTLDPTPLILQNLGRRYVRVRLQAPHWLRVSTPVAVRTPGYNARYPSLGLIPGQHVTLFLSGTPLPGALGPNSNETLELRLEDMGGLVTGHVLASVSLRTQPRLGQRATPYLALLLPLLLIATCAIVYSLPRSHDTFILHPGFRSDPPPLPTSLVAGVDYPLPPTPQPPYPEPPAIGSDYAPPTLPANLASSPAYPVPADDLRPWGEQPASQNYVTVAEELYWRGYKALNAQQLDAARDTLEQLHQSYPVYHNGDVLLCETYYQLATRAYGAKQWSAMQAALVRLLELNPNYKDAAWLLSEAYYHPGKIAFERGDYVAAQADLQNVWQRDPAYLDTKLLLMQCYTHLADAALAQRDLPAAATWVRTFELLRVDSPELRRLQGALEAARDRPTPTTVAPSKEHCHSIGR